MFICLYLLFTVHVALSMVILNFQAEVVDNSIMYFDKIYSCSNFFLQLLIYDNVVLNHEFFKNISPKNKTHNSSETIRALLLYYFDDLRLLMGPGVDYIKCISSDLSHLRFILILLEINIDFIATLVKTGTVRTHNK